MDAPLTTFSGFVKQIDVSSSDYLVEAAFQSAFANFSSYASQSPRSRRRIAAQFKNAEVIFQERHNRRFAGTTDFPNGRSFTVCNDVSGDDARTMLDELTAYSSESSGPHFLFDLGYDYGRAGLQQWGPFAFMPYSKELLLIFDARGLNQRVPTQKIGLQAKQKVG